jgi:hypothetical protein
LIEARVWIRGDIVVALSLRPNYHVTVGLESTKSTEISVDYSRSGIRGKTLYTGGSDGGGTHTCYCFISLKLDLRKADWQAVRLAVKSDGYPPLKADNVLIA